MSERAFVATQKEPYACVCLLNSSRVREPEAWQGAKGVHHTAASPMIVAVVVITVSAPRVFARSYWLNPSEGVVGSCTVSAYVGKGSIRTAGQ